MQRREFLSLSLGFAGLTALSGNTVLANTKTLQFARPENGDLAYINVYYPIVIARRYKQNHPRIVRFEFRVRDRLIDVETTDPYNFRWTPIQADWGQGTFTAQAFAGSGELVWSKTISIIVTNLPPDIRVA
jgi:hypothetical protein